MSHIVWHEDKEGQAIDVTYYCSDYCARSDKDYAGWNGCFEIPAECESVFCATCKTALQLEEAK